MMIYPIETSAVLKQLQKKITEVEALIMEREKKGLIRDPELETAYHNIEDLRDKLILSQEKMFKFGLYFTIYADAEDDLEKIEEEIKYATLPEMFAKHTSLFAINKVLKIIATKPSPEIKKVLQLEENCPVILVEQKLLSQNQSPMGWGQLFIKYDYFNLAAYSSYSNRQEYRGG